MSLCRLVEERTIVLPQDNSILRCPDQRYNHDKDWEATSCTRVKLLIILVEIEIYWLTKCVELLEKWAAALFASSSLLKALIFLLIHIIFLFI